MKAYLEKLNPWITLVANLGVLVGLVLLLVELSQNTEALRNQTEYANVSEWIALSREYSLSPDMADIVNRGNESPENLSAEESLRYFHYLNAYTMITEASFHSITNGTYGYGLAQNDRFVVQLYSTPGGRAFWSQNRGFYSDDFTTYVDRLLEDADAGEEPAPRSPYS